MRRGQIFIQDLSVSLAISIITIFSIIAFINFNNAQFESSVRATHEQAILDRVAEKMFIANEYAFNPTGQFKVNADFAKFVKSLNDEEVYERFRNDMGLSREGVSYDIQLELKCDDSGISGGIRNDEALRKSLLVSVDGKLCNTDVWVSKR